MDPPPSHPLTTPTLTELSSSLSSLDSTLLSRMLRAIYGEKSKMVVKEEEKVVLVVTAVVSSSISLFVGLFGGVVGEFVGVGGRGGGGDLGFLRAVNQKIQTIGFGMLLEKMDDEIIENIGSVLRLPSKSPSRVEVADEMLLRGVLKLYEYFPYPLLKDVALDLRLTPPDTKDLLIDKILQKTFDLEPKKGDIPQRKSKKRKRSSPPPSSSPERSPVHEEEEEGGENDCVLPDGTIGGTEVWGLDRLTADLNAKTIYTHYNMSDLKAFCRQHQISQMGKKSVVIKRIRQFFEKQEKEREEKEGMEG